MSFTELETKEYERIVRGFVEKRRPPSHIRHELDLGHRFKNQSVEIFEIRPVWNNPHETLEIPVAKATFVRAQGVWRVFWQRADLKWHRYDPDPEVERLEDFLSLVDRDQYCCFFG